MKPLANVAASVRQRLLNLARIDRRPFNELLQYYAMERFLYRLSQSTHRDRLILKGALMLQAWHAPALRPTMDIDLLGRTSNEESNIINLIQDVLAVKVEPDGLVFDPASLRSERITENADYQGIRVYFRAGLDSARVNMQIDIGFGDIVFPEAQESELPTLIDLPAPRLLGYTRESAIAEKFEAMVKLGTLNSRMKDFFDIWLLSRQFDFEGASLMEAIRLTFQQRGTVMPLEIEAFGKAFAESKQVQWAAFRKRLQQEHVPSEFREVLSAMELFLAPIVGALTHRNAIPHHWIAAGIWQMEAE